MADAETPRHLRPARRPRGGQAARPTPARKSRRWCSVTDNCSRCAPCRAIADASCTGVGVPQYRRGCCACPASPRAESDPCAACRCAAGRPRPGWSSAAGRDRHRCHSRHTPRRARRWAWRARIVALASAPQRCHSRGSGRAVAAARRARGAGALHWLHGRWP